MLLYIRAPDAMPLPRAIITMMLRRAMFATRRYMLLPCMLMPTLLMSIRRYACLRALMLRHAVVTAAVTLLSLDVYAMLMMFCCHDMTPRASLIASAITAERRAADITDYFFSPESDAADITPSPRYAADAATPADVIDYSPRHHAYASAAIISILLHIHICC